jgi:hypothetical protein
VTASEQSTTLNLGEELEVLLASDEVSFENDASVSNEATGNGSEQMAPSNEMKFIDPASISNVACEIWEP